MSDESERRATMKTKRETIRVVCLGNRVHDKDRKSIVVQRLAAQDELMGRPWHFTTKKSHGIAGCVYEIDAEIDGDDVSIIFSTMRFQGTYHDTDLVAQWKLESQAADTELAAVAQARKAKRDNSAVLECLEPLMNAYMATNPVGRLALEVRVLHYMRSGGTDIKR